MSAAAQNVPESSCPTCAARAGDSDSGAAGAISASQVHCADQAPLTAAIAEEFALEALRAYLERPNVVIGNFGEGGAGQTAPPAEQSAPVEIRFDVGEFSYYQKTVEADAACDDSIHAPAHVAVRIGNGLLSFEADGVLWKGRYEPSAHFYADADLATATGSYRPSLDLARVHVGTISVALYAASGHLRGDVNAAVVYFRDKAQLQRLRQGAWGDYAERLLLFRLGLPGDACWNNELPFAYDEAIEQLDRQSAGQWRARAIDVIGATPIIDAVWKDGSETQVAVEIGEPVVAMACLGKSIYPAPASESALRIPVAGRLRSTDGLVDMSLDELVVGIDRGAIVRATVRSRVPPARLREEQREALGPSADVISARLNYDFEHELARLNGIVELLALTSPTSYRRVACVAFPRGGKADVDDCRYASVPPSLR